jgi:ABC-type uncharacterized transport system, permease component
MDRHREGGAGIALSSHRAQELDMFPRGLNRLDLMNGAGPVAETAIPGAAAAPAPAPALAAPVLARLARRAEAVAIPLGALAVGLAAFSVFLLAVGKSPAEFYSLVWKAGYGTAFSWWNTLSRTAPLLLAALCVALPARLGLTVIGGEGAIVLGGVAAGAAGVAMGAAGGVGIVAMGLAGALAAARPNR